MPTYQYSCPEHGEFEDFHSSRDDAKLRECPMCRKEKDIQTPVERLICGTSKGVVELTGQEMVEKSKEDAAKYKREVYGSEKLYSNVLGEAKYQSVQQRIDRGKRGY